MATPLPSFARKAALGITDPNCRVQIDGDLCGGITLFGFAIDEPGVQLMQV